MAKNVSREDEKKIVARLVERVRGRLNEAEQHLEKYQKRFAEDPADALEWSEGVFGDAMRIRLYKAFLRAFDESAKIDDIREYRDGYLHKTMMTHVLSPARSTSACANIMSDAHARECARLIDLMDGCCV